MVDLRRNGERKGGGGRGRGGGRGKGRRRDGKIKGNKEDIEYQKAKGKWKTELF